MITVYDMTSGTLRKEREEGRQTETTQQAEMVEAVYAPGLQLQEVVTETPHASTELPQHMFGIKAQDFIDTMK